VEEVDGDEARIDALERRLADLEGDFDQAEARTLARPTDKQLMALVRRELNTAVTPLAGRLQAMERLGAQLRTAVDATTRELGALRALPAEQTERVDDIEQAVITLAHRVTALGSDLDGLIQGIASINTEVSPTRRRVQHR
jgi:chromosome segregation ATPase